MSQNEDDHDGGVPGPEGALTIDEMMGRLERLRQRHGGETRVYMSDGEPVCSVVARQWQPTPDVIEMLGDKYEPAPPRVVVTDRY